MPEGESLREIADAMGWHVESDDWFAPDYAAIAKIEAQTQARCKRAERKAARKLERQRIEDMESLDYRFTGFGPNAEMTFAKGKAEAERSDDDVLSLATWRRRHAG